MNENLVIIDTNKNKLLEIEKGLNENEFLLSSLNEEGDSKEKLAKIYANINKYRNNLQVVSSSIFVENSKIQSMNSIIHKQNLKIQQTNMKISKEMQKIGSELQNNVGNLQVFLIISFLL